jgi:purine-binding chemotaxis protein CheW
VTAEAPTPIAAPEAEQRWLLVSVSDSGYSLELESVREVVPVRPCTPIPGTPAYVRGLLNLRGRVLTVVDLAALLGLPATTSPTQRVIVLHHAGLDVGIVVEEVHRIASALEEGGKVFEPIDSAALLGPIFESPEDR